MPTLLQWKVWWIRWSTHARRNTTHEPCIANSGSPGSQDSGSMVVALSGACTAYSLIWSKFRLQFFINSEFGGRITGKIVAAALILLRISTGLPTLAAGLSSRRDSLHP